jgi:hypothetical protein
MNQTDTPPSNPESNVFTEWLQGLSQKFKLFIENFLSNFGGTPDTASPEQRDRALLAAEISSPEDPSAQASIAFNDVTNPLVETGEESPTNFMRPPSTISHLAEYQSESGQPCDSWVEYRGKAYWSNETGLLFDVPDVRFLIRDGYNPAEDGTIENFMQSRMQAVTFLGCAIEGGVHPVLAARLRQVETEMSQNGVFYSKNGTNTVDSIDGFDVRSIQGTNRGIASRHFFVLAIYFSKNDNNQLCNVESDNFEDYIDGTDYSVPFYNTMTRYFRGFMDWVANRRNGGERDTMQFDLVPDENGTIPYNFR